MRPHSHYSDDVALGVLYAVAVDQATLDRVARAYRKTWRRVEGIDFLRALFSLETKRRPCIEGMLASEVTGG